MIGLNGPHLLLCVPTASVVGKFPRIFLLQVSGDQDPMRAIHRPSSDFFSFLFFSPPKNGSEVGELRWLPAKDHTIRKEALRELRSHLPTYVHTYDDKFVFYAERGRDPY